MAQTNDYTPFGSEFDSAATGVNPGLDHRYGRKKKARFVPDGTVTYFDLWPGEEAGIKNYQETLPANYHTRYGRKGKVFDTDITGNERIPPQVEIPMQSDPLRLF